MIYAIFLFAYFIFVSYFSTTISYKREGVMEHSEIVQKLSDRLQITPKESNRLIRALIKLFTEKLSQNNRFSIPGFGTFGTKVRKERKAYNPGTKTVQLLPKKNVVYFRPASKLKEQMRRVEAK